MRRFNDLSLRHKLTLPLALLAGLFLYPPFASLGIVDRLGARTRDLAVLDLKGVSLLLDADRELRRAQVAERSLIFLDVESEDFKAMARQHAQSVQQAQELMAAFAKLGQDVALFGEARIGELLGVEQQAQTAWRQVTERAVAERSANTRAGRSAAIDLSFREGARLFEQMRGALADLSTVMRARAERAARESTDLVGGSRSQMLLLVAFGTALCAGVALLFPRLVVRPIDRLIAHLDAIAEGDGDLTVRLSAAGRDETGRLADAFNRFLVRLHRLVSDSLATMDHLGGAASRLSDISAQSNQAMAQQLVEIDQVVTAMNEMTATVGEVARNASEAAGGARLADEQARAGKQVVALSIHSTGGLAGSVQEAAGVIHRLQEASARIGTVLGVMKSIAEQTNLLALNAAIEAARAGEQGRGFAVVADEVRGLTSRTRQSTREIQQMIESLQARTADGEAGMVEARARAEQSVQQAAGADGALQEITRAVAAIHDMNTRIASAAQEQSTVTEEVSRNTTTILALARRSAEGSRQSAAAAQELAALAQSLRGKLARFKV